MPTAEYGRNSGGQVAMVTRSGGNEYHGTLFWFYRTPRFNANEWENNLQNIGKRQFVQNIPGFSLGGPVFKNRTFFFTNMQWLGARNTGSTSRTVYTESARNGVFRYVKNGRNQPAGVTGASVDSAGNILPGVNIGTYDIAANDPAKIGMDPTIKKIIAMTPLPNDFRAGDGLNTAGYNFAAIQHEKQYDGTVKIDHVLNNRNTVFGRFAWGHQNTMCDQANSGEPAFPGLTCRVDTYRQPRNLALNWRWNPAPNITNELVGGYNRFNFNFVLPLNDAGVPYYSLNDVTIPLDTRYGNERKLTTYQLVDNFSYVRGPHTFKLGMNLRFQQHLDSRGSVAGENIAPVVNFSTTYATVSPTQFNEPKDINTTYDRPLLDRTINNLLGRVGAFSQGFVSQGDQYAPGGTWYIFDARFPEMDFYWQDNWKVRRNLTLDLGLRWELKPAATDANNTIRAPNQPIKVGASASNTVRWDKGAMYKDDMNNFGPSVGVAWDPFSKGKTSVRANYRLAYDRIQTFVLSSFVFQSIPGLTLAAIDTGFGQGGGRLPNLPKPAPPAGIKPSNLTQPTAVSVGSQTVVDPDLRSPKTNMWSLSIQQEILPRTVLEVSYIGRKGVGLLGAYNVNQMEIRQNGFVDAFNTVKAGGESPLMNQLLLPDSRRGTTESGSQMVRRLYTSQLSLNSVAALASAINGRLQNGRSIPDLAGFGPYFFIPFPQYSGGIGVLDSNDYSTYNSLQVSVNREVTNGVGFLVSYALAKSLDTRSFDPTFTTFATGNSQSAGSTPFDIYNRKLNYAISDFDRTHVFQSRWTWELPTGKGRRFFNGGVLGKFFGGFEATGFMTIQTGRPMTVYSGSNTVSNVVQTPANCNGCGRDLGTVFDDPTTGYKWYFNAAERASFSAVGAGAMGNTTRNYFRGPGAFSMDLGILKRTFVTEKQYLEFRADFTNLLNHPNFSSPTLTMTSTTFGRIYSGVSSGSRKMQLGLKYYF